MILFFFFFFAKFAAESTKIQINLLYREGRKMAFKLIKNISYKNNLQKVN